MSVMFDPEAAIYPFPPKPLPLSRDEKEFYREKIKRLLKERDAVMVALKNPPPKSTELSQGALIRFETPICFVVQNVEIHVQDFRITKYGKAIRFSPVGHNFLARITKWRERKWASRSVEAPVQLVLE